MGSGRMEAISQEAVDAKVAALDVSADARAVVNGLLQVSRESRISMADLKESAWSIDADGEDQPESQLERGASRVCDSTSMIEEPPPKRQCSVVASRSASTAEL